MGIKTIIILLTIAVGGTLVYQDVNDRVEAEKAERELRLRLAREAEISRCETKAARLRNLIGTEPDLKDHLATAQGLVNRLKGWADQSRTNLPPDLFDVARDMEGQVRQIGQETMHRDARIGDLKSIEAYMGRLRDEAPIQIGMCS